MICKGNDEVIRHMAVSRNAPTHDSRFSSSYFLRFKF
jgi:hypothetical protein